MLIRLKYNTAGAAPVPATDLSVGELALDTLNGKVYMKHTDNTLHEVGGKLSSLAVSGAATIGTTLGVTGAATFSSTISATGHISSTAGVKTATFGNTTAGGVLVGDKTLEGSDARFVALNDIIGVALGTDGSAFALTVRDTDGAYVGSIIDGSDLATTVSGGGILGFTITSGGMSLWTRALMDLEELGNQSTTVTHSFVNGPQGMIVTLTGNAAIANPTGTSSSPSTGIDIFIQDSGGSKVPASWGSNIKNPPTLSTAANKKDMVPWFWDGTYKIYGAPVKAYV